MEAGRSVHIVVDPFRPSNVSEEAFEEMISEAATFLDDALQSGLEVAFSIPHVTLRSDRDGAVSMFRALALLEAAHEPVAQAVDRDSVIFTVTPGVGSGVLGVGA